MTGYLAALAIVLASIPVAPSSGEGAALVAQLCNGGTIAIPLEEKDQAPPAPPCAPKACHAGNCRKHFDRSQ